MAAPTTTLSCPASATATQAHGSAASSGADARRLLEDRLLTHGIVVGQHIQDAGYYEATVPAGAPGTLDVNLLTALKPIGGGAAMVPVAGKLVYLEVVRLSGADLRIRRSGANAVALISGTTDTLDVPGAHAILLDCLPQTSLRPTNGLDFDATHKQLQLESTAGCVVAILGAVV